MQIKKHKQTNLFLKGAKISLRLVEEKDCCARYVSWLEDKAVNQFLETRWAIQSLDSIREFVNSKRDDPVNYLFAIIENDSKRHIGNIKLGPINFNHGFADVSYFIGERDCWGKGYATEAIKLVTRFGFEELKLHSLQAGLYESNTGSKKALENAGFQYVGRFKSKLKLGNIWQDHLFFHILAEN